MQLSLPQRREGAKNPVDPSAGHQGRIMSRKPVILMLLSLLYVCPGTLAQTREKLALLIRNIYGPNGLLVDSEAFLPDGSNHSAHSNSEFHRSHGGSVHGVSELWTCRQAGSRARGSYRAHPPECRLRCHDSKNRHRR